MRRILALLLLLLAPACAGKGTFEGILVDGLTDQPLEGVRIVAKAEGKADLVCQVVEGTSGPDGLFRLVGTCPGVTYRMRDPAGMLFLAGAPAVQGGQDTVEPVRIKAWPAPEGTGLYRWHDGSIELLRTNADMSSWTLLGSDEKVWGPARIPGKLPVIGPGEKLAIVGRDLIERIRFMPLIKSGERRFGDPRDPLVLYPWSYLGVRFLDDRHVEKVEIHPDPAKTTRVEDGDRAVLYVDADAVPPGRYGLAGPKDRRLTLVVFGHDAPANEGDSRGGKK